MDKTSTRHLHEESLKVCGPEFISTLRGRILGREVALIVCGESHEDAIDLTRKNAIIEPVRGWKEIPRTHDSLSFDHRKAYRIKRNVSLNKAMQWARIILKQENRDDEDGSWLVFDVPDGETQGVAYVFSDETKPNKNGGSLANAKTYVWCDQDCVAYAFNERRLKGEEISLEEHDTMIFERKGERVSEGIEFFDDWLLRQYREHNHNDPGASCLNVHVLLEAPVSFSEVELHVEEHVCQAPPAHECLKAIELDSDEDPEEIRDPDDGCGHFATYMLRRLREHVSTDVIHGVDARNLGELEDPSVDSTKDVPIHDQPEDLEEMELCNLGAELPQQPAKKERRVSHGNQNKRSHDQLPSWEAFFGAAADLIYYAGNTKADYVPFLVSTLKSPDRISSFFEELYFGTVPRAIEFLGLSDKEARSRTRIRSLAYRPNPDASLLRRPDDCGLVPIKVAPLDRYLKARDSNPPRTWISELASKLQLAGGKAIAESARALYREAALKLLADPKGADRNGDFFLAWLRECHRDIFDSIDTSDPCDLCNREYVQNMRKRKHKCNIGDIRIPNLEQALTELHQFNASDMKASSKRQRILAKIIVEAFQLQLVDLAVILRVATIAATSPASARIVMIVYVGSDHARQVISFWKSQGFNFHENGFVGKDRWDLKEPRGLQLPGYLHDLPCLFSA